jgi:hypothetical protein
MGLMGWIGVAAGVIGAKNGLTAAFLVFFIKGGKWRYRETIR